MSSLLDQREIAYFREHNNNNNTNSVVNVFISELLGSSATAAAADSWIPLSRNVFLPVEET